MAASKTHRKIVVLLAVVAGLPVLALMGLSLTGLLKSYTCPTQSMEPTIVKGAHFYMEGVTYLLRKPARGEIVVFKTEGLRLAAEAQNQTFVKRVAGLPGETLYMSEGKLYVNGVATPVFNRDGEIRFETTKYSIYMKEDGDKVTVPAGCYFVIGDNMQHSSDSRDFGFLPAGNVKGRAAFCYWPLGKTGALK